MRRKTVTIALAICILLPLGTNASAANNVSVEITSGTILPDDINGLDFKVRHTGTYTFTFSFEADVTWDAATLGFTLYSPDGSLTNIIWNDKPNQFGDWGSCDVWNLVCPSLIGEDQFDGSLPDALLTGGVSLGVPAGYGPIASTPGMDFTITFPGVDGGIFCIDSAFFPPAGVWLAPPVFPTWSGGGGDLGVGGSRDHAFCVTTSVIEVSALNCLLNPGALSTSHCEAVNYQVMDIDLDPGTEPIIYSVTTTGAGEVSIDAAGNVTYIPTVGEIGLSNVTVHAIDSVNNEIECVTDILVINNLPIITCPPSITFVPGNAATSPPASVSDPDVCDTHTYSLVSVSPIPFGVVSVDPSTGTISFDSDQQDRFEYDVCISVTDGIATDECCITMTANTTEPFCVSIDQTDKTDPLGGSLQGHQVEVCLNYDGGSFSAAGFDFLIEYDNSALSFIGATEGNIFPDYKWEYFTYRFGPNGNCTGGCPSGKLRVIGIADQNDGASHPTNNYLVVGDDFACLTFLVSNDRNLACQFAPIRWCWLDCGDNVISSSSGDTLYISRRVFDYIGTDTDNIIQGMRAEVTGADQTFPTSTGAPSACDVSTAKAAPIRFIDFKHGGVQVICADLIDDRGDINLNGLSNEIADATMFTNYFVEGLNAFGSHIEGSIAASEVNGDGLPLTVADLVYLIRVIVGDAQHLPKETLTPNEIIITTRDGIISCNSEIGAALFVFDGYADIDLLATNMNLKVGQVAGNTQALVYNIGSEVINAGDVLQSSGALLSVEAANYNGIAFSPSLETVMPISFALHQNYPNPFNPSTTISIDFPKTSEYSLTIYNVRGQKVKKFSGTQSAGTLDIVWEPSELPSGVYFYKLRASDFVATKKLVLLK